MAQIVCCGYSLLLYVCTLCYAVCLLWNGSSVVSWKHCM